MIVKIWWKKKDGRVMTGVFHLHGGICFYRQLAEDWGLCYDEIVQIEIVD